MSELDDPKIIAKKESKDRLARRNELADVMWVLSTLQGRRFYWRLLARCGIFRTSFVGNERDRTAFNEGERNVGLGLLTDMNDADVTAYMKCVNESKIETNLT